MFENVRRLVPGVPLSGAGEDDVAAFRLAAVPAWRIEIGVVGTKECDRPFGAVRIKLADA